MVDPLNIVTPDSNAGRLGCCVVFVLSEVQTPFNLETVWMPYIPQRSERGMYIEARHIFVTDDHKLPVMNMLMIKVK